jgi:hypothetical protein
LFRNASLPASRARVKGVARMGQATIDLPDPMKSSSTAGAPDAAAPPPPAPVDAATADDLLSQLAGEEIDRLLAEADAQPVHEEAPPPPDAKAAAGNEMCARVPDAPKASPALAPDTEKEIEAVLKELGGDDAMKEQAEPAAAPAPAVPASSPAQPDSDPIAETQTQAAERAGLAGVVEAAEVALLIHPAHADARADAPTPFYLKPLEWLNAPLMACPEAVRELLGKVAIITLLNAVAVIVYVIMFRKR